MKKYRLLLHGSNFLIDKDGKPRKQGFYQNVFIEAANPRQAELMVISKVWHDQELKQMTLNKQKDPPKLELDTFWEMDEADYVGNHIETSRTFYLEKNWWEFWK